MATKKSSGRKYSPAASKSVEREMTAFKEGKLKSGSGQKVTNPKQAIAIGLSEARAAGRKVPPPPAKSVSAKKTGAKSAVKKPAAKKTVAKKVPAKKTVAKKVPAKKTVAKKAPAKKAVATKPVAKKSSAKKSPAKKSSR